MKILFLLLIPFLNAEISSIFGLLHTPLTLTRRYDIHIQDIKIKNMILLFFIKYLLTFHLTNGEFLKYRNLEIDLQFVENDGCCSKYRLTNG